MYGINNGPRGKTSPHILTQNLSSQPFGGEKEHSGQEAENHFALFKATSFLFFVTYLKIMKPNFQVMDKRYPYQGEKMVQKE